MNKIHRNIVWLFLVIKSLLIIGISIGLIMRLFDQYTYTTSGVPEHQDFAKANGEVLFRGLSFVLSLILSVIVDFKEQKSATLKKWWYLLTLFIILCYILISQLKNGYLSLITVGTLTVVLIIILQRQKRNYIEQTR